ncbi:unnamed protein product [Lymnaea stagnalis]|uniref:Uncharacterized protein n=1 Tax=Lymnaea stagnalis TaxID=6523 RepID=A0AAV2HQK8_LYMST
MGGLRPSGLNVNKPVVFGLVLLCLVIFLVYRYSFESEIQTEEIMAAPVPETLPDLDEAVLSRESKEFNLTLGDKSVRIHVEQVLKKSTVPKLDILFLHGASFTSQNWLEIKSLDHVANWGYRGVAIDLPGKGKTDAIAASESGKFLDAFISALHMSNVVIVSPSASGVYSLSYLFDDPELSAEIVKGFVPIAPVQTHAYTSKYSESQIPTLIVYGTKDSQGPLVLNDLKLLPKSEVAPITDAGHACYMDKPDQFHKVLYNFLQKLSS